MAGMLTHVIVSSVLLAIVWLIFKNFWYGLAIGIGQLVPDVLKFGITGIKLLTFSPVEIMKDSLFWTLQKIASSYQTWLNLGIFLIAITLFLVYFKVIKKKEAEEINWAYLFLVIGIAIHLIIDIFIIEKSFWI